VGERERKWVFRLLFLEIGVWHSCRRGDSWKENALLFRRWNSIGDLFSFCVSSKFISYFLMAFVMICPNIFMPFIGHGITEHTSSGWFGWVLEEDDGQPVCDFILWLLMWQWLEGDGLPRAQVEKCMRWTWGSCQWRYNFHLSAVKVWLVSILEE